MSLGQTLSRSYRELQQGWARLADRLSAPAARDEMARGEFISAFISEGGMNLPASDGSPRKR